MKTKKLFVAFIFLFLSSGISNAASWVNFPESWDIGQAFAISITSNADYSEPVVTWKDRSISL
ncbi:MAG: hypothetical protein IJP69_08485, partial [Synergistaceae bacterium]|nr:hypothetical protein [Synergistaceae bacterium]